VSKRPAGSIEAIYSNL